MGYYSEVGFAIPTDEVNFLQELVNKKDPDYIYSEGCSEFQTINIDGKNWTIFLWNFVKWYPDFPEVAAINEYMETDKPWCFIRLGEEYGDDQLEDSDHIPNIFGVIRSIDIYC